MNAKITCDFGDERFRIAAARLEKDIIVRTHLHTARIVVRMWPWMRPWVYGVAIMTYNEVRLADSIRSSGTLVLEYSASCIQVQAFNSYTLGSIQVLRKICFFLEIGHTPTPS